MSENDQKWIQMNHHQTRQKHQFNRVLAQKLRHSVLTEESKVVVRQYFRNNPAHHQTEYDVREIAGWSKDKINLETTLDESALSSEAIDRVRKEFIQRPELYQKLNQTDFNIHNIAVQLAPATLISNKIRIPKTETVIWDELLQLFLTARKGSDDYLVISPNLSLEWETHKESLKGVVQQAVKDDKLIYRRKIQELLKMNWKV